MAYGKNASSCDALNGDSLVLRRRYRCVCVCGGGGGVGVCLCILARDSFPLLLYLDIFAIFYTYF